MQGINDAGDQKTSWQETLAKHFQGRSVPEVREVYVAGDETILSKYTVPALQSFDLAPRFLANEPLDPRNHVVVAVYSNLEQALEMNRKVLHKNVPTYFVLVGAEAHYTGPLVTLDGPCLECVTMRSPVYSLRQDMTGDQAVKQVLLSSPFMYYVSFEAAVWMWRYMCLGEHRFHEITRWDPLYRHHERAKVLKSPWCTSCR